MLRRERNRTKAMTRRRPDGQPPVIRCDPRLAAFLGAVAVRTPLQPRNDNPCMVICAHDGTRWLWPVEHAFREAILRG